ncbi:MAG: GNAT family N-acetyltransferase [Anaerolineales bacterium]|nr:GNAT family N-acetyltransferase [Anaerolineales bacterium]
MTSEIILRPATLTDAQILAQLWAATFPDKFGPILGDKAERVLCDWLRLSERHLQTTTLAEIDETVAGFMVLETSSALRADDGRWLWHALQLNNGIFGALRGMLLMLLIDRHHPRYQNEIYIEMLGVDPAWRGRGVAYQLIAHAEAVARQQSATQLALAVVNDNLPAIQLYEKMGFTTQSEQRSRLLQWITGHSGYYTMAKELSTEVGSKE